MASNDEQRSATTILTTAAQSIAARLIANETTAKFTKAEISTTNLFNQSVTELQVLTSLDNVQQTADINTVTVINNNTVNVNVAIDQTKAPNNYQMNSVGLFAVDGDGKEVLYSVTVLKDPVYIHQDAMGSALGIDLETVVGQASNVEISVNPAGAVTNEILKATLADYVKTDDVKSLIPATVIDGSKPADFKESVTLEKGAVDGAGNAVATIKDLADGDAETLKSAKDYADTKVSGKADDSKVVHTADMRKPASDVAGIEEVSTLQTQVDNSAVGANLLYGTAEFNPWTGMTTFFPNGSLGLKSALEEDSDGDTAWHLSGTANSSGTVGAYNLQLASAYPSTYTFSASVKGTFANTTLYKFQVEDSSNTINSINWSSTYSRWVVTGNIASGQGHGAVLYFNIKSGDTVDIWVKKWKLEKGSVATDWCPNPSEILTKSDDSKVAHLSGANNFDTVPTVNNNPLLLASSLPSDLARTGQDANFTGKLQQNGQDVALANNTIARNPDTSAVVDSVNFTGTAQKSGSSILAQSDWVKSDNDSDAKTASSNNLEGFYYTEG